MGRKEYLNRSDFFQGLSQRSLQHLASICIPRAFKKRQILFLEGHEGGYMFLLLDGHIQLYKDSEDGKEVVIKLVGPGEIFGEVVLFERDNYPVNAVALKESRVLLIPKREIHALLKEESFRNDFVSHLMKKQRYLTERILDLTLHDVEERFFRFLFDQYGTVEEIVIPLSKRDVAATIGTTQESLSRLIRRLKQKGEMVWRGKRIRLREGFWR